MPEIIEPHKEALIRRLAKLKGEELRILKDDGLKHYRPHSKQEAFHVAGRLRRAFFAGNRTGKSTAGTAEDAAWLRRERVWYPAGDPRRTYGIPQHPIRLLILTIDWDKVDEIFTSERGASPGKLWRFLPRDLVKSTTRNHSGVIDMIELTNGSLVRFDTVRAWLANPNSVESSDWDAIHVDEPIPEQMWKGASRGLMDRGGAAWFTLTPLTEPWIWDYFTSPVSEIAAKDRWYISCTIYDNPYLKAEDIARFEAELSDEEKQCRLLGLPLDKAGLVYKEFQFDKHVLKEIPRGWADFNTPPKDWSVFLYIDPHPQTPHAVLFFAIPPGDGGLYLFDEIFEQCPINTLCELIFARLAGHPLIWSRIDKLAYINNPTSDFNMAEAFIQNGINVEPAVKDLNHGILAVKEMLKKEDYFHIAPNCTTTLYEFSHYVWGYQAGKPTNKPVDRDDHMMENLYRCVLDQPRFCDLEASAAPLHIPLEV